MRCHFLQDVDPLCCPVFLFFEITLCCPVEAAENIEPHERSHEVRNRAEIGAVGHHGPNQVLSDSWAAMNDHVQVDR